MFMKTFEENWTAWVDGKLSDAERAEFEASLDDRVAAEAEKNQAHKLGALLREQLQPRPMGNEEFFHHQLRGRIAAEMKESVPPQATAARESWWTIRRLLWTGASSLALFAVCTFFVMREKPAPSQSTPCMTKAKNSNASHSKFSVKRPQSMKAESRIQQKR